MNIKTLEHKSHGLSISFVEMNEDDVKLIYDSLVEKKMNLYPAFKTVNDTSNPVTPTGKKIIIDKYEHICKTIKIIEREQFKSI